MNRNPLAGDDATDSGAREDDHLGPSDSTDSASDLIGASQGWHPASPSDSDAAGTGERASADGPDPASGADILPDRIIQPGGEDDADGAGVDPDQPDQDPPVDPADGSPRRPQAKRSEAADFARERSRMLDA